MNNQYLNVNDLTQQQLIDLLETALDIKKNPQKYSESLKNKHFAMLFEKPSLRTRASFSVGIEKMGGMVHFYDMQNEKIGQRETACDLINNLQQWYQGLIARVDSHLTLKELTQHANIPVINALCDQHHPCQALADILSLYEINKDFSSWHIAYLGDGNNVAQSLADLCLVLGIKLTLVTPNCGKPSDTFLTQLQLASKGHIQWTNAIEKAEGANVVYTDVWQSMGANEKHENSQQAYQSYQVNTKLMKKIGAKYFMHCQPVHRGEEATDEVCDSEASIMYQQAGNRMTAQQALLHLMFHAHAQPVTELNSINNLSKGAA